MTRARGIALGMAKVAKVETYRGYTRVYVEDSPEMMLLGVTAAPSYRRMYFRQDGGHWVVSEPSGDELGGEQKRTIAGVDVEYWAVDEDIVEQVARETAATRDESARRFPWTTTPAVAMRVYPTAETVGLSHLPGAAAAHLIDSRDRTMRVYELWWSGSPGTLAPFSRFVLADQILGLMRETALPRAYLRMDWWLRHGPGHALAGPDPAASAKAVCADALTWKQMYDAPPSDQSMGGDMAGDTLAPTYWSLVSRTTPRAFAQARSMAEFVRATYGERGWWDLWVAYGETPSATDAYARAIKTSPERFFSDWTAWARGRC